MPGDGLALAVRVGREDDVGVLLGRRAKLADGLSAALDHLVARLEAGLDVDRYLLFRQVADVAHRGADIETVTQEPLQGPRLGGGLDDDQAFRQSSSFIPISGSLFHRAGSGRGILRPSFAPAQ